LSRRVYPMRLNINGRQLERVVIDPHYEAKHGDSVTDETILALVTQLDGKIFGSVDTKGDFEYFMNDRIELDQNFYKLIWLLQKHGLFIGVINAYRR
jgi:hypothetical protein